MVAEALTLKAKDYFNTVPQLTGQVPPVMLVDFVIEKFKQRRAYPPTFTDEMIEKDMNNHITTMAMAVVDLYLKTGAFGELSHSENGISRTFENAYISNSIFSDILPYVKVM